ncbi:NfrA family protein [Achromobacter sp. ESBL13]|uniref:NfrA family protein n=1 Tax=Achromobacter sp. ESBL13 TaxID=3077328 RepID=UPI002FCB4EA8
MTPLTRSLILSAALAGMGAAPPASAQSAAPTTAKTEAPLEGAAFRFAEEAYKNFDAGHYELAARQAASAIVLRPDVERLHLLRIYALQKQGKLKEADQAAADAIKEGIDTPALRQARANLRPAPPPATASAPAPAPSPAPGTAAAPGSASAPASAAPSAPASPAASPPASAYRRGYPIATRAYADYKRGDYAAAASGAERAFRIDPKQGAWAMLWLDALEAQNQYAQADAAIDRAIALGAPNKKDLAARRQTMASRMAAKQADAAYQALSDNRADDAVPLARQAVSASPDTAGYRMLLITALMQSDRLAEAEAAATDAINATAGADGTRATGGTGDSNAPARADATPATSARSGNTTARVMRGYLRQRQGKTDLANADFDAALKQRQLTEAQRRSIRLLAADAALAGGENARALALMTPLGSQDSAADVRIKRARSRPAVPATLTLANYPAPVPDCRNTPPGAYCDLLPSDAVGSGGPAARAYAAYAREAYAEAIAQARLAVEQDPANQEYQRLLTTTLAAGKGAQLAEAHQRMTDALVAQPDDPTLLMQRGYLRQRTKQPALALQDFQAARATGKAPPTVILDEGYARAGAGDKRGAVADLQQAIDEADAGKLELTPQQRFDTRSGVAELSREWGGYVSAGYRGARPASSGLGGAAITVPGDAIFSTAEIFWRPADFLNSATQTFELYGRFSNTLYDKGGKTTGQTVADPCGGSIDVAETRNEGIAGLPTTVGSLGMRFTPSTEVGLTFGIERQFNLGTATRQGTFSPAPAALRCALNQTNQSPHYQTTADNGAWLAYITYGLYEGTNLRIDRPDWFTMEGYLQGGYSWQDMPAKYWLRDNATGKDSDKVSGRMKRDQAFGAGELRVGRSYRMDALSDRLVFFPYAVVGADWLWNKNRASFNLQGESFSVDQQGNGSSWSLGAGPGFNVRYWFREDHYNAPRSYLDLTTQYRFNIGGGAADRARGLFINLTLSY